jgi:hypothetical protein
MNFGTFRPVGGEGDRNPPTSYRAVVIRIQECRQPKPGTHTIIARLVGFDLYAAQLGQALFETAPSWKPKTLVGQWRSPEWQGGGPTRHP